MTLKDLKKVIETRNIINGEISADELIKLSDEQ